MFVIPNYMPEQPVINARMRSIVTDWMVGLQQEIGFCHEALYTAVKMLDIFLSRLIYTSNYSMSTVTTVARKLAYL
jgi:hypothetical protein